MMESAFTETPRKKSAQKNDKRAIMKGMKNETHVSAWRDEPAQLRANFTAQVKFLDKNHIARNIFKKS